MLFRACHTTDIKFNGAGTWIPRHLVSGGHGPMRAACDAPVNLIHGSPTFAFGGTSLGSSASIRLAISTI